MREKGDGGILACVIGRGGLERFSVIGVFRGYLSNVVVVISWG